MGKMKITSMQKIKKRLAQVYGPSNTMVHRDNGNNYLFYLRYNAASFCGFYTRLKAYF